MTAPISNRPPTQVNSPRTKAPEPEAPESAPLAADAKASGWAAKGAAVRKARGASAPTASVAATKVESAPGGRRTSALAQALTAQGLALAPGVEVAVKTCQPLTLGAIAAALYEVAPQSVTARQLAMLAAANGLPADASARVPVGTTLSAQTTPKGLALRAAAVDDGLDTVKAALAAAGKGGPHALSQQEVVTLAELQSGLTAEKQSLSGEQALSLGLEQLSQAEASGKGLEQVAQQAQKLMASPQPALREAGRTLAGEAVASQARPVEAPFLQALQRGPAQAASALPGVVKGLQGLGTTEAAKSTVAQREVNLYARLGQRLAAEPVKAATAEAQAGQVRQAYGQAAAVLGARGAALLAAATPAAKAEAAALADEQALVAAQGHLSAADVYGGAGDVEKQLGALASSLGATLGLPDAAVKAALTPDVKQALLSDGQQRPWYRLDEAFSTTKVGSLSAGKLATLTDAIAALPEGRRQAALDAVARYADAAAGASKPDALAVGRQLLGALAGQLQQPALDTNAALADARYLSALGNEAGALAAFDHAQASAAALPDVGAGRALSSQALVGKAGVLLGQATQGPYEGKKPAADALRALRSSPPVAAMGSDFTARLSLMEMQAYLGADQSVEAKRTLDGLKASATQPSAPPWLGTALTEFEKDNKDSKPVAFLQVALAEATSESMGDATKYGVGGMAAGAAAGAAVGSLFFGVGALPGAAFGALLGGAAGTLGLKARNLARGAHLIREAGQTGLNSQTAWTSVMNTASIALDVASVVGPVKGLGKVGTVGIAALSGVGTAAAKADGAAMLAGLSARVERAAAASLSPAAVASMSRPEVERLAKEMLLREYAQETLAYGGRVLPAAGLATAAAPFAAQLYQIQTSGLPPAEAKKARAALLARFSESALTMAVMMAPAAALSHAAMTPTGLSPGFRQALQEAAPRVSVARALEPKDFQQEIAARQEGVRNLALPDAIKAQLEARYQAIAKSNTAAFDPVTGDVLLNKAVLDAPGAQGFLSHELTHQRFHGLGGQELDGVVTAFTRRPEWPRIKEEFLAHNPAAAGYSSAQIVDEVLAEVHGAAKSSPLKTLVAPVLESPALKRAGLDQAPAADVLQVLRQQGVAPLSDKNYLSKSRETQLVGYSEAAATGTAAAAGAALPKIKAVSQTSISATFDFGPGGKMLNPGDELRLEMPEHLRKSGIRSVMLSHRQDPAHDTGLGAAGGRDANPGLTAVNLRSMEDGTWRDWNCPWGASGPKGAKFAEQRGAGNPEFENMFDWNSRGHVNADTGSGLTTAPLKSDEVRILSVGKDPVFVHKLIVNVMGETPAELSEGIFSPGTAFGDWNTGAGRKYGGGQAFQGTFPEAVALGQPNGGAGAAKLPAGWVVRGNSLEVDLAPGKVVTGVDIAAGDSHPDKIRNKDGGWGTSGWARVSMGIKHADGSMEPFVDAQGVPPEGVLTGAPVALNQVTRPGDKLVVTGSSDTLYVMGLRIGLKPGG